MSPTMPKALQLFLDDVNKIDPVYVVKTVRELTEKNVDTYSLPKLHVPLNIDRVFDSNKHAIAARIYHPDPQKNVLLLFIFMVVVMYAGV